jgi:transposase-like protein
MNEIDFSQARVATIVAESYRPGVTAEAVAHRYGLSLETLMRWRREANNPPRSARVEKPVLHRIQLRGAALDRAIDVVLESRRRGGKLTEIAAKAGISLTKLSYWRVQLASAADERVAKRIKEKMMTKDSGAKTAQGNALSAKVKSKRGARRKVELSQVRELVESGITRCREVAEYFGISISHAHVLIKRLEPKKPAGGAESTTAPVVEATVTALPLKRLVAEEKKTTEAEPVAKPVSAVSEGAATAGAAPSSREADLYRIIGQQTVEIMRLRDQLAEAAR